LCTCGKKTIECSYWESIIDSFYRFTQKDWEQLNNIIIRQTRTRRLLFGTPRDEKTLKERELLKGYLRQLFLTVANKNKASIIIEDSKNALYAQILSEIKEIDLYCVQLIRDPRAVAYSWTKRMKLDPEAEIEMPRFSPLKVALLWTLWNIAGLKTFGRDKSRIALLNYEDLIQAPVETMERISQFTGVNFKTSPWLTKNSYELSKERHLFTGNPNRFNNGVIPIRMDELWKTKMPKLQQKMVESIASMYFHLEHSEEYKHVTRL
jgi:hypothetical protein